MSIKSRYVLSVLFDMILVSIIISYLMKMSILQNISYMSFVMYALLTCFYLFQDIMFINRSFGKIIFGIKVVAADGVNNARIPYIVARRTLELFFMFYLLFRTYIDSSPIARTTRIVLSRD